jgi:ketosteroid isomerase-like protein
MTQPAELAHAHFGAISRHDLDALREVRAPDAVAERAAG